MIITLTGDPGSGKSSVAKMLAKKLGYQFYSMGDLRGQAAQERGMNIIEWNQLGETDAKTDDVVDAYQQHLGETEDNLVIDGRLSWYFIPDSYKILLRCDPMEAGRRVYEAKKSDVPGREDEPKYTSVEDAAKALSERVASDFARYGKYYGVTAYDPKDFDLVIDTTSSPGPAHTLDLILSALDGQQ